MASANKPMRRWTDNDLMGAFLEMDKQYFGGKLPLPLRLSFSPIDGLGHTFRFRTPGKRRSREDRFGIHISPKLKWSRRLWYQTLVHEAVHLEQRCQFACGPKGKYFNRRMKELAVAGIFDGIW